MLVAKEALILAVPFSNYLRVEDTVCLQGTSVIKKIRKSSESNRGTETRPRKDSPTVLNGRGI